MTHEAGAAVGPVPPPAYFAAAFVAGLVADRVLPWRVGGRPASAVLGGVAVAVGGAITVSGVATVLRHGTTVVPHHAASALVTSGPYRFSRNPIYAGLAATHVGAALVRNTWWPVAMLPAALTAVRKLVIEPEEAHLAERFGDAYAAYRARVRRWV